MGEPQIIPEVTIAEVTITAGTMAEEIMSEETMGEETKTAVSMTASMKWAGGIKFEGQGVFGHSIITDGKREFGGAEEGYKPTELILFGLIGCTGVDVVRLLEKMRQKLTGLEITARASQPEEYPKPFTLVEMTYVFSGDNLDPELVKRAVELSKEKYCVVSQTLAEKTKVTSEIIINQSRPE